MGRRLMKVEEVMRGPEQYACVPPEMTVQEALRRSPGRAGALCVVGAEDELLGIFTDGDLRRRLRDDAGFAKGPMSAVMTANPKRVVVGRLAQEAAKIMEQYQIDELPVVDDSGRLRGVIDIQDLLAARLLAP